jgi:DNA-binding response OmpR family regulator
LKNTFVDDCFSFQQGSADTGCLQYAIVEDERHMALVVSDMLASRGVAVEVFTRGADLLKSSRLMQFKAIILDLSLPDIDGFDLMDTLAASTIGLSIVVMSGRDASTLQAAQIYGTGIGLHVRGALAKPFAKEQLFAALGLPG